MMNRPERSNALSLELVARLREEIARAEADTAVRVLVITGAGRSFCAGADLKEMAEKGPTAFQESIAELLVTLETPVIAALNGHAVAGGLEMALASDLRVASAAAQLGLPEAKRGLGARFATVVLPRLVPMASALEMLYTGDSITAQRALEIGLVNRVVPPDEVYSTAMELAQAIAHNAPLSVRRMKANAWGSSGLPLAEALKLDLGPDPYNSVDAREGTAAFADGRPPSWRDA
jgi:enoyl-CoA hydratase/carnithine racemase